MPKLLEKNLRAKAKKKFPNDKEKQDAYIYGTLRKQGGRKRYAQKKR